MKSFDEATRQVTDLMVAIGGSVDAYEDEKSSSAPLAPAISSFEAAHASVQAHIQHNEPMVGSYEHIRKVTEAATGKTEAELLRDMASLSEQLGGLTTNPLEEETPEDYPSSADEDSWTAQELSFLKEMNVDPEEAAEPIDGSVAGPPVDDRFNAEFFDDLTDMFEYDQAPKPVEPFYKLLGAVYAHGELQEIHTAFKFAQQTGEPQKVTLDSGEYEMTPAFGGQNWELHDTGKGRKYVQESVHHMGGGEGNHYDLIEADDLFIWVIPDDDSVEDLGYLHNMWVFLREEE
jgi:hypothetical protein